jgi:lipoprotein-releasing system permease protein
MSKYNLFFLLANRISRDKTHNLSRPIVNISTIGVTLGVMMVLMAMSITSGYQTVIREKVVGMGSHIRISNYDDNYSFDATPFEKDQFFLQELLQNPDITHVQFFATKVGIIKTDNQVEGVVLKGIDSTFYFPHFQENIIEGENIKIEKEKAGNDILISSKLSKKLHLKTGDKVRTYFVQEPLMQRSFTVSGIFETGLPEFDESFALVDLRHVQKLNQWDSTMIGGIEILIEDYDKIDEIGMFVNEHIGYHLKAETIKEIYPHLFEWIALLDINVLVLMVIIISVCIVTLISTFFIIVLEQTPTIGILKTLGLKNSSIISVFLILASKILIKGLLAGNVIAIFFAFFQNRFHLIKLDAAIYYVPYIPVEINVIPFFIVNIVILFLCMTVLMIPSYYIAKKITPVKAIRFD